MIEEEALTKEGFVDSNAAEDGNAASRGGTARKPLAKKQMSELLRYVLAGRYPTFVPNNIANVCIDWLPLTISRQVPFLTFPTCTIIV